MLLQLASGVMLGQRHGIGEATHPWMSKSVSPIAILIEQDDAIENMIGRGTGGVANC